jgi:hypothetical protein
LVVCLLISRVGLEGHDFESLLIEFDVSDELREGLPFDHPINELNYADEHQEDRKDEIGKAVRGEIVDQEDPDVPRSRENS